MDNLKVDEVKNSLLATYAEMQELLQQAETNVAGAKENLLEIRKRMADLEAMADRLKIRLTTRTQ